MNPGPSVLGELRRLYHKQLQQAVWCMTNDRPTNADIASVVSIRIAKGMLEEAAEPGVALSGQTAGKGFTDLTVAYLQAAFSKINHLRPGQWQYSVSQNNIGIAAFEQYEHLAIMQEFLDGLKEDPRSNSKDLRAAFAKDYLITPDIMVCRAPIRDEEINEYEDLLMPEEKAGSHTPLRVVNNKKLILHASVSCKWTIRSDRAQNSRTEALNMIRNRKGHTPHIVVVVGEPLPTRLASIALGTGDIDCVYHMALPELEAAVSKSGDESQGEMLDTLVRGRRLRDISDLPFDLAI